MKAENPNTIPDVDALDQALSAPTPSLIDSMARLDGDMLVLGAAGKMGPSLCRLARRASDEAGMDRTITAVSRFSSPSLRQQLEQHGVRTIACDLLDDSALRDLPDAENVVYMAGMKFGSTGNEGMTWAMNTYLPARVQTHFPQSRIVAFSTGNVYGMAPCGRGGSVETDTLNPLGEYAMSCVGRERMFEYFSGIYDTPVAVIRLNYACELRYGVLVDIARWVWEGRPIDLTMGHFNVIWQRDANAYALMALEHAASPPLVLNVTGEEILAVDAVARQFAQFMGKTPRFKGQPGPACLLSNARKCFAMYGGPPVTSDQMIAWIADWVMRGRETLDKLTHFEVVNGQF
jgi:nucleoside-diphosphate-sugar epimerase